MARRKNLVAATHRARAVVPLDSLVDTARAYAGAARSENTARAYASDWRDFNGWCLDHGLEPLPAEPQTLSLFLTDRAATLKPSTLQRRLTAISQAHQRAGHRLDTRHPAVREVWAGIRRTHGTVQQGKAPVLVADLRDMLAQLPDNLLGARDRALLLLGFAGAFRRSELVGLDVMAGGDGRGHVEFTRDGLVVTLTRSKTDQEGQGRQVGIPYGSNLQTCPVRALQDWLTAAGLSAGPVFRWVNRHGQLQDGRLSDKAVAKVVKRTAFAAAIAKGTDEKTAQAFAANFSGHSLRAGLATSAAAAGVPERAIMAQTGHKRTDTLRKYIRLGSLFRENAAAQVGL